MALRVGFNATPLLSPLTGIGNYIAHLGAALAKTGAVDAYSFYGGRWQHQTPSAPAAAGVALAARVRNAIKPFVPFKRELRQAQRQMAFTRGARRNAIELYHEPNYVPFVADVPVVITVHDLSWMRYPETHPADRVRWLERAMPRAIERAAAVLVDSEFTRQEVLSTFGLPPARVHAVHLGVASSFRPLEARDTSRSLQRMGLAHGEYVLTLGTIEPRKNLAHVLEAYAALPAPVRNRYALVVAGERGWRAERLERQLRDLAERSNVVVLGQVPAADLPSLYAGAAAFVFPSFYEGFGLPPLEAMACGVPVLVSDRASLPEVAGDAAVIIDPERPDLTAHGIEAILADPVMRAEMIARGTRRAATFTWEACAMKTLDAYHCALRSGRR